ncbi:MAG TPA: glycosyltransferase family 4 protein [Rickettsiales bacterium]|nr:glycosyltransferase family 4 protein [Rickettsiales bacterium]
MRPVIVHISNDYPDPLQPDKTLAIRNLVEATPEFRHVVYSLNRVNGLGGITSIPFGEDRTAVAYGALPKGLFWERRLEAVADWISADMKQKNIVPDLIEAHKITVEGIIGQKLAAEYNCKLVCDIQGGSDYKLLKFKRNLWKRFGEIAKASTLIFPYAPWVVPHFEKAVGLDPSKCRNLPVLPGFDALSSSSVSSAPRLITLLRFSDRKNKNIASTIAAVNQLAAKYPAITLDIYGGGGAKDLMELRKVIDNDNIDGRINFKGPIANNVLTQIMGQYSALVMPSFTETYGLVYAEALFCGVPVLFTKGQAIDGYFDTTKIGYACNPASVEDIAAGIEHLLKNEAELKRNIAQMQASGALDFIRRKDIIDTYRNELLKLLPSSAAQ